MPVMRGQHTATCASGARAETRAACDCGAGPLPYRARVLDEKDAEGRRLVEIQIDGPLSTAEVGLMTIMLQELIRVEGERWARADMRKKP